MSSFNRKWKPQKWQLFAWFIQELFDNFLKTVVHRNLKYPNKHEMPKDDSGSAIRSQLFTP
jgi:hypothetical protein